MKTETDNGSWVRIAIVLVVATMVYNLGEAVIALWLGAEAESIALFGFGLDSLIEFAAAVVLLRRLSLEARGADEEAIEESERLVSKFVGATFFALAAYVVMQGGMMLWLREPPSESVYGIVLAAASLLVMPLIAWGKLRAAREIGSSALRAEARETLACAYLSFALLLGLTAYATLGWWWADPVAALLMVPWLVKEGIEGFSEDGCGHDH